MRPFKIGDFVECVSDENVEEYIKKGEVYEVEYVIRGFDTDYYIYLKNLDIKTPYALHPDRFIRIWDNTKLGKLF